MKRMSLLARAAESIGDGDIVNVQIRRYRQWQLSQTGCLASCIIPYVICPKSWNWLFFVLILLMLLLFSMSSISSALLHGQREVLEQVMIIFIILCVLYISLDCVCSGFWTPLWPVENLRSLLNPLIWYVQLNCHNYLELFFLANEISLRKADKQVISLSIFFLVSKFG